MAQVRKRIAPPLVGSDIILVIRPGQNINQILDCTYQELVNSLSTAFAGASGFVPETRTLTINGVTYDLTQDRSWTVSGGGAVDSVNGQTGVVILALDDLSDVNAPSPTNGQVLTWNGTEWAPVTAGIAAWGSIASGTGVGSQADLVAYLAANYQVIGSYVLTTRTITINGLTQDLSANRTWSVGTVTGVTATAPITSSGGTTPVISTSMNTNKLIGRGTTGVGVMEEITLGTNLSLSGTTLNATGGGIKSGNATQVSPGVYTATISGVTSPYLAGDTYIIKFDSVNDGDSTLNISGVGAIPMRRNTDVKLNTGAIKANQEITVVYDGTNFQLIGLVNDQILAYVHNAEGAIISKGQAVYAYQATGGKMSVKLARADSDATSAKTIGLVYDASIGIGGEGYIITQGVLEGVNTSMFSAGDTLYLSGVTFGAYVSTPVYAPTHFVYVGIVERANANGQIYVRCQNGYELDELHNVQAQSPALKDTLWYDSAVTPGQWKTASIASILGYTPLSQALPNTQIFVGNISGVATAVAMSGDTTISNTGAVTIANNAVTYAKMQAVSATSRLLGSSSTTTPVQEITIGSGLSLTGTTLAATGSAGNSIQALTGDVTASASLPSQSVASTLKTNLRIGSCGVTFDGQGGTISNGKTAYVQVPYAGTITAWYIVGNVLGSCTVTVFKDTFAAFPPVSPGDNIFGTQPALASAQTASATGLSVAVTAGDWIGFTISGVTTVSWVNLTISITKT